MVPKAPSVKRESERASARTMVAPSAISKARGRERNVTLRRIRSARDRVCEARPVLSAAAGQRAAFRIWSSAAPRRQPVFEPRASPFPNTQPEPCPPPQNVVRRPRQLHAAEVIGFPLVKLRQQLFSQVRHGAAAAEDVRDASTVRMGVPVSQRGGKPRMSPLEAAKKSAVAPMRQVTAWEQCTRGPATRLRAELARQNIDCALGELAVGRDLAAQDGEERGGMPVELESIVACDARWVRRLVVH